MHPLRHRYRKQLRPFISAVPLALFFFLSTNVAGQDSTANREAIAVIARPSADSITLRWAPRSIETWQAGNQNGYVVERYVIARNNALVTPPERMLLTATPVKPWPETTWESLVKQDKYAAIGAQALFGDRFEIDLGKTDVMTIVNKVRETEQRFSFALFCADMSPGTAKAMGLWFTDRAVRKEEKYLYRILVATQDHLRGSSFTGASDGYSLPPPQGLQGDFLDGQVSLRWEKNPISPYSAYDVERSADGKTFRPVSNESVVTFTPPGAEESRYEYASDSLPTADGTYFYRVRGISPFGEHSEPSEVVSGKSTPTAADVPNITDSENVFNTRLRLTWEYPAESNRAIRGFSIERANRAQGQFAVLTPKLLPPETRGYEDSAPGQVNYYRVKAHTLKGDYFVSPPFLAQLIDSLPPAMPIGLKAKINDQGVVALSWAQNPEVDLYGYRVYRANFKGEELSQITSEPTRSNAFNDRVNVNTLNDAIYYSVMAVDRNQNSSPFSELLRVSLPDKIKPQPPVVLPPKSEAAGILLSWWPSGSEDVVQYDVYRQKTAGEWLRVKVVNTTRDTLYQFLDAAAEPGREHQYILIAVDDAGLESDPTPAVRVARIDTRLPDAVVWNNPEVDPDNKHIKLRWKKPADMVASYQLFRSIDDAPLQRYRSIGGSVVEWIDRPLQVGRRYTYQIVAVFANGRMSALSEKMIVRF
jgi:hypothetical protein